MGYPVIARLANLSIETRNKEGTGGTCVVGWLSIVCDFFFLYYLISYFLLD